MNRHSIALILAIAAAAFACTTALSEDGNALLTVDHYVRARSTVPSMNGQTAQLYVRERVAAGTALRSANLANRVGRFVPGPGTPAVVAFDLPHPDSSRMVEPA